MGTRKPVRHRTVRAPGDDGTHGRSNVGVFLRAARLTRVGGRWHDRRVLGRRDFLATLPRRRIAVGALIRDVADRVCLVEPTYKLLWHLPGGTVQSDESPAAGCRRELREELGVDLEPGPLLCIGWVAPDGDVDPHGALMMVYDAGVCDPSTVASFTVPPDELKSFRFVDVNELGTLASEQNATRVSAALGALSTGRVAELESGRASAT